MSARVDAAEDGADVPRPDCVRAPDEAGWGAPGRRRWRSGRSGGRGIEPFEDHSSSTRLLHGWVRHSGPHLVEGCSLLPRDVAHALLNTKEFIYVR